MERGQGRTDKIWGMLWRLRRASKEIYENFRKKPAARIDGKATLCYTVY